MAHASYTKVHLLSFVKAYHEGQLTICPDLCSCTNQPFYYIVAAHKCPRGGCFVDHQWGVEEGQGKEREMR